jgi:8-oxo-dGTP diphosphatase
VPPALADPRVIRIAAALIDDGAGRLLLVRKAGTTAFMQAGGKIEPGEAAEAALRRELAEELNWTLGQAPPLYLGAFSAPAANEPGCRVAAEVFALTASGEFAPAAELAEVVWMEPERALGLVLAPLTRDHMLPLFLRRRHGGAQT